MPSSVVDSAQVRTRLSTWGMMSSTSSSGKVRTACTFMARGSTFTISS